MVLPYHQTDAQRAYTGHQELQPFADFLPHIGELALTFAKVERHVTWAIESFLGATRWDGNELEGMVQNFSSRIKMMDIAARPKCEDEESHGTRKKLVEQLKALNAFRNKLMHCSATGISASIKDGAFTELRLNLKRLDANTGKETSIQISLAEMEEAPKSAMQLISDLRRFVHRLCPDAEKRVP